MAKKPKKKKPKLSAQQRAQIKVKSAHKRAARSVFRNSGFLRAPKLAEKTIDFHGMTGEFDDAFVFENVLLLVEYTVHRSSDEIRKHIKNKHLFIDEVVKNPREFIELVHDSVEDPWPPDSNFSSFHPDKWILRIVYCSRYDYDASIQNIVTGYQYLDYPTLKYFEKISGTIRLSTRHELFSFLEIEPSDIATGGAFAAPGTTEVEGSILPESASGFSPGYKVVSFYASADSLLRRAYVLRRDGWRGSFEAYQRMLLPSKVEQMRSSLKEKKQVFTNNLIVTLPSNVLPLTPQGQPIKFSKLTKTSPVKLALPLSANSVGIVDGQHRLYSYYETKEDDPEIAKLRSDQNLLITGIIFPDSLSEDERERFEAELFLTINANQTTAAASLRQEIEVVLNPYSQTAIGKQVMQRLAKHGPLFGHVESYFFEKGKLKTTSIVSYGLGPLIKTSGDDSLFKLFAHPQKQSLSKERGKKVLDEYVTFCEAQINILLSAIKSNVPSSRWTTDRKTPKKILTVTYINSFLIVLRKVIEADKPTDFESLRSAFEGISSFNFQQFHSSQYNRMAEEIYKKHFAGN